MHTEIFEQLKNYATSLGLNMSPGHVTCDFEIAAMNALSLFLPNSRVVGCLFYFGQTI